MLPPKTPMADNAPPEHHSGNPPPPRPSRGFLGAVLALAGGTAFAQILAVAASPVVTRLFAPTDFGLLGVYTSLVTIPAVVAPMGYHLAVPLPDEDSEAINVLTVSLSFIVLTGSLVGIALAVSGRTVLDVFHAAGLLPYAWLVPLGVCTAAAYEAFAQWAIRKKAFLRIAKTSAVRSLVQVSVQTGTGLAGLTPAGLLLAQFLSQSAGIGSLGRLALLESRVRPSVEGMRTAAKRYRRFPLFLSWAGIFNAVSVQAPPLLLAHLFHPQLAGFYLLALRAVAIPMTLVAQSTGQVYTAAAVDAQRSGRLASLTQRVFEQLLGLAAAPMAILAVAAPDTFAVVFGSGWRGAGIFAQWLVPWMLLVLVAFPLNPLTRVLERQSAEMAFQVALMSVRLLSLTVGGWLGNPDIAVALFGIGSGASWLAYLVWLLSIAGVGFRSAMRPVLKHGAIACLFAVPLLAVRHFTEQPLLTTGAAGVAAATFLAWKGSELWRLRKLRATA